MTEFQWFVGIDWGTREHVFSVIDDRGQARGQRTVTHRAAELAAAFQWVRDQTGAAPAAVAVGLEVPRGVVVDAALEYGFAVFALNPKQTDRFRDRFTMGGAKDDARDAATIAAALRTDRKAFRRLQPEEPALITLREWARLAEDLTGDLGRLTNRLREQLFRVDAPWLRVCPAADEPWLWTLLGKHPDPAQWPQIARRDVARVLRRHHIRRLSLDDVVTVVQAPALQAAPGVADAVRTRIVSLVPQLTLLQDQLRQTHREMDRALETLAAKTDSDPSEHRDAAILQSLPGSGRMVTATMLTETSGALSVPNYPMLSALTGAAPITKRSGRQCHVQMRRACNARLRDALYHWARASLRTDPAARAFYDHLRQRGHRHARALRSVAARWLRILVAMLRARTLYDPARFPVTSRSAA